MKTRNPKKSKPTIQHFIIMGDSLSDRGTMKKKRLCYFIPMSKLSGLDGRSPNGRFTNGYAWSDHLSAMFSNELTLKRFEKSKKCKNFFNSADISDAIITGEVKDLVQNAYSLDNNNYVNYLNDKDFIRNYDEGGLTAHDYSWVPTSNIVHFFTRLILTTLAKKRENLLKYDELYQLSKKHKERTLVIEWSGANDLITVNNKPSKDAVDKVIRERVRNIKVLIANGYQHFALLNLPDLSLTPRYQGRSKKEQADARHWCEYFNQELAAACEEILKNKKYQRLGCTIEIADVYGEFNRIYENAAEYGFDEDKLIKPYTDSADFKIYKNETSPAKGYMFWDDVHPTADMHVLLTEKFFGQYKSLFNITEPDLHSPEKLYETFREKYIDKLRHGKMGFASFFNRSTLSHTNKDEAEAIKQILKHALYENGERTREVLVELGWIDERGNLKLIIPVLTNAVNDLKYEAMLGRENSKKIH